MLESSRARIEELADDALVLDVGGWASPLGRADWVIDLAPYETRGLYGDRRQAERFTDDTWIVADICDRAAWPFEDGQFDFVVCSHTLEDLRDPVWVAAELQRVGRAGYIEVPSRIEEQTPGLEGDWVGWSHHRWLVDIDPDQALVEFVHKPGLLQHRRDMQFPRWLSTELTTEERVQTLWWEGSFTCRERHFEQPVELEEYLRSLVTTWLPRVADREPHAPPRRRSIAGVRARVRRQ